MKQVPQLPTFKCEIHPGANICSIQVEQKCPYKSRLACMKCIIDYKKIDNFIEISELVSTESVIKSCQNIQGFNNKIGQYLLQSQQQYIQIIDNYIQQLHNKVDALKASVMKQLDNQKTYLMKTAELIKQYDAELTNLQNKMISVSKLTSYHNTKEWVELKECIESYVSLFYQPVNQEIIVTYQGLDALIPKSFNPYQRFFNWICKLKSIQECKDSIGFDKFCKPPPFTNTILDNSIITKQIIDRITDKGTKSMKLLFSGQRDGMYPAAFWKHCENKFPTIIICESQSGQIFGGYTPCKWINKGGWIQDASISSFLFSVTKQQIYPLKKKDCAIYGDSGCGPTFGNGHDLYITANFETYSYNFGSAYDTSQYQIADPKTHLLGATPAKLKNIEVYLIE